jgi:hypothetical protein
LFGEFDGVSPGDPLWIAGYPLVAAGLIRMVRLRAPGRLREALLAVAGATFSVEVVTAAFYPFGDCCCSPRPRCWCSRRGTGTARPDT